MALVTSFAAPQNPDFAASFGRDFPKACGCRGPVVCSRAAIFK
jgi:hypothetical protein